MIRQTRLRWTAAVAILLLAACGQQDRQAAAPSANSMAAVGATVVLNDGEMVVDVAKELSDPMMAMHKTNQQGFAGSGMAMSNMSADPIPDGMRRIRVDLRVKANDQKMDLNVERFAIVDPLAGGQPIKSRHSILGDGSVEAGAILNGLLEFDIPTEWDHAMLSVSGADAMVHLGLAPSTGEHHAHTDGDTNGTGEDHAHTDDQAEHPAG